MPGMLRLVLPKMFYLDLFRELRKHEVQYLVVDGIAINLHGVVRATMDVDLVLAMDESQGQADIREGRMTR